SGPVTLATHIGSVLSESGTGIPVMYPLPDNMGLSLVWSKENPDFKFCALPISMNLKKGAVPVNISGCFQ
ncbi:unnamed protein product, partial [Onchocerca ochengi]